jgi:hypothetical protein
MRVVRHFALLDLAINGKGGAARAFPLRLPPDEATLRLCFEVCLHSRAGQAYQ